MNNDTVELLAPAGNSENFITAINCGANAIYIGLTDFSARKNAGNFNMQDLPYYLSYAHLFNVKVYVAVNTVIKNCELENYIETIKNAYLAGVDAFIVQDVFIGRTLKRLFPDIVLHLSTQAGVNNVYGAKLAYSYGFKRVILARETSIDEIKKIANIIETEVFVQGALCTCFSGHCYLSSFIGGKSGNRGLCRQPCRKEYKIVTDNNLDSYRYALSLADLCMINRIDELKSAGVKSFKIEGRMRSFEYVSASCQLYRSVLDNGHNSKLFENLKRTYNRGNYTEGLTFSQDKSMISDKIQNHMGSFVGRVLQVNGKYLKLSTNYKFNEGDCFKIINQGYEIGNGVAVKEKGEIKLAYSKKAYANSEIFITKDTSLIEKYKQIKKLHTVNSRLIARVGENLKLIVNDNTFTSDYVVQNALTSSVTKSEIKENLRKKDVYPFEIIASCNIDEKVFIPKNALNKLRANAYSKYYLLYVSKNVKTLKNKQYISDNCYNYVCDNIKSVAIISKDFSFDLSQIKNFNLSFIFTPESYTDKQEFDNFFENAKKVNAKTYLYLPALFNEKDEETFTKYLSLFDGVYCEGSFGIYFAKKYDKKIFGGIELNVTNNLQYECLQKEGVEDICLSKELSYDEIEKMQNGYVFCLGDIKVMTLEYCPFKRNCKNCDKANLFYYEDRENRKFTCRRYKLSNCAFELYNNSRLFSKNKYQKVIFDFSASNTSQINAMIKDYFNQKDSSKSGVKYTNGNLIRGVE